MYKRGAWWFVNEDRVEEFVSAELCVKMAVIKQ